MRDTTPFKFTPDLPGAEAVEFTLRPLDLPGYMAVQLAYSREGIDWPVIATVAEKFILGWSGVEPAYSRGALREVLANGENKWGAWFFQITAELFRRSMLSETERKN